MERAVSNTYLLNILHISPKTDGAKTKYFSSISYYIAIGTTNNIRKHFITHKTETSQGKKQANLICI
jgi:hypothetical protein